MGRFVAYDSLLFANADLLEQQRWEELASKAGIVDTSHFRSCTVSDHAEVELAQDVEEGDQLGINATPTVMLNGHIFVGPPRELVLDSVIARTLASGE
jgi:protein-disulfide isomerase